MALLLACCAPLGRCATATTQAPASALSARRDLGVYTCSLTLPASAFPELSSDVVNPLGVSSLSIVLVLRYTSMPGSGAAQLRGFVAADVPATKEQLAAHPPPTKAPYDPAHEHLDLRLRLVSNTSRTGTEPRAWSVSGKVPFPAGVQRRALPGSVSAELRDLPQGFDHSLTLEALGGTLHGPGTSCALSPGDITHALDPRGMAVEQGAGAALLGDGTPGAVVVMKPPYNLAPELIDRHVEHHAILGFHRCVAGALCLMRACSCPPHAFVRSCGEHRHARNAHTHAPHPCMRTCAGICSTSSHTMRARCCRRLRCPR